MAAPTVHTLKWGIFDIAYEAKPRSFVPAVSLLAILRTVHDPEALLWRFFKDVYNMAPLTFLTYMAASAWLGINTALSLQFSYIILQKIEASTNRPDVGNTQVMDHGLIFTICAWLSCAFLSVIIERFKDEKQLQLCGHLRSHFLPLIVQASLNADVKVLHDREARSHFPNVNPFGEGGPGWDLLKGIVERVQDVVSLVFQLMAIASVLLQQDSLDRYLLGGLIGAFCIALICSPSNGANGAGYTFWTTNTAYNRLHSLYSVIFSDKYRETLAKDGINDSLSEGYRKCSQDLGVVKSEVITLACLLPAPWYWAMLRSVFFDYPMAVCALLLVYNSSSHILATLVFFQSATSTLRFTIEGVRRGCNLTSLSQLLSQARAFYKPLDQTKLLHQEGVFPYPNPSIRPREGMEIELKDVTFQYPGSASESAAVKNISVKIAAGSFVLLVGVNGSGKSTLLKLLARLREPTSGTIVVDGTPTTHYDLLSMRQHTTFLMQSEEIYPVSLTDNLLMAVPRRLDFEGKIAGRMDEAIRLGGSQELIKRVGYTAVLNPPTMLAQSLQGCGNGTIGAGAFRELEKHIPRREVSISNGEKQRFLASRSFMRLLNSDTRLLMVDEPTSALDSIAERDLFEEFLKVGKGKTVILVTSRFGSLAKRADLILCLNNNEIVEEGHHDQLMALNGEYAKLYNAQQLQGEPSERLHA